MSRNNSNALQPVTSAELAQVSKDRLDLIDQKARDMRQLAMTEVENPLGSAIATATALQEIREMMLDKVIIGGIMKLQGTKLGFVTDKDKHDGYHPDVVVDVTIEAASRGARMIGNEVNIISGACYFTKNYFKRKLDEVLSPGNWRFNHGVPKINRDSKGLTTGSEVSTVITWSDSKGSQKEIVTFPIKADKFSSLDQILGKADRKCGKWLLENITGERFDDGDADDMISVEATTITSVQVEDDKLATDEQVAYVKYLCGIHAIMEEDKVIDVRLSMDDEPVTYASMNSGYKKLVGLLNAKNIPVPTKDQVLGGHATNETSQPSGDPNFDRAFVMRTFHALGNETYGTNWDKEREKLVSTVEPTAVKDDGTPSAAKLSDDGLKEALDRLKIARGAKQ